MFNRFRAGLMMSLLLFSFPTFARFDIASRLIDTYGNQCPTVITPDVSSALSKVRAMVEMFKQLQQEGECVGASYNIPVADNFQTMYGKYLVYADNQNSKIKLERKIAKLTFLLESSDTLSDTDRAYFEDQVVQAQSQLIDLRSDDRRFSSLNTPYARAAQGVTTSLTNFLNSTQGLQGCLLNKSQVIGSVVSSALQGAGEFLAPGASVAAGAAGVAASALSAWIRAIRFGKIIDDFDRVQMSTALQCVSEVFTKHYCEAADTKKLIDAYRFDDPRTTQFEGLELLNTKIRNLDHWLREVFAGSEITGEGDLVTRVEPIRQFNFLNEVLLFIPAYKNERLRDFQGITDQDNKNVAIANAIRGLVFIMTSPTLEPCISGRCNFNSSGQDFENPIWQRRDSNLMAYQLYDPSIKERPFCDENGQIRCGNLTEFIQFNKDIQLGLNDWNNAVEAALATVNDVLSQVIVLRDQAVAVDAYRILTLANRDLAKDGNALEALDLVRENAERIQDYLLELGCKDDPTTCEQDANGKLIASNQHRYAPQIIDTGRTLNLASEVLRLTKEGLIDRTIDDDFFPDECRVSNGSETDALEDDFIGGIDDPANKKAFKVTTCISNILKLRTRGTSVFMRKIRNMVSYEIEARASHDEFDDELRDILYLTRGDLLMTLRRSFTPAGSDELTSLDTIYHEKSRSQKILRDSLLEFFEVLDGRAYQVLRKLKKDDNGLELTNLCLRLMPMIEDDSRDLKRVNKVCQDVVRKSIYKEGPKIAWKDYVDGGEFRTNKSEKERFCAFRDYQRDNRIIEDRRNRRDNKEVELFRPLTF